jgi:hypothetical protein
MEVGRAGDDRERGGSAKGRRDKTPTRTASACFASSENRLRKCLQCPEGEWRVWRPIATRDGLTLRKVGSTRQAQREVAPPVSDLAGVFEQATPVLVGVKVRGRALSQSSATLTPSARRGEMLLPPAPHPRTVNSIHHDWTRGGRDSFGSPCTSSRARQIRSSPATAGRCGAQPLKPTSTLRSGPLTHRSVFASL